MANNRDSSKQKRARQNRAQREAREARAKAAAVPAEERKAKYASATSADAGEGRKAKADRPRRERPVRPGDVPVDLDTLEGSWFSKRMHVPGGRQMLFGFAMTVIISVLAVLGSYADPDATGKNKNDAVLSFSERFGAIGYVLVVAVLLASGIAAWATLSPNRRRIWIACSIVAALGSVYLGFTYLISVGFLVYGIMRAQKIEGPVPGSRAARTLEARQQADAGTVDAEE